ncbi:hypothetical protein MATL_G00122520 [Megalops atlanticus]|uniref:Trans-sialidase n=1 Tax=Megalops atlanticus TaxID=7932 RepID=A0A9D3T5V5_MEGAT|nr:hypothetical protein MATL_G00122520 [Megalops atlanticus]
MWIGGAWGRGQEFGGHVCTPLLLFALSCSLCAQAAGVRVVSQAGESASRVSVAVVLFPTDPGEQEAASDGVTPAPTSEHDDDNSLLYTGLTGELLQFH